MKIHVQDSRNETHAGGELRDNLIQLYGCSLELRSTQRASTWTPKHWDHIRVGWPGERRGRRRQKTSPQNHSRYDGGSRRESRRVGTTSELSCPRKVLQRGFLIHFAHKCIMHARYVCTNFVRALRQLTSTGTRQASDHRTKLHSRDATRRARGQVRRR